MVRAVGFSHNEFNPAKPGRLCRGRERWIEPWFVDDAPEAIHRLVVSGAAFEDDSARDALRGVDHAGLDMVTVVAGLYPRKEFLAFVEDGHPADIPEDAEHVELYDSYRAGGREAVVGVRWVQRVTGVHNLRVLLESGIGVERIRGFCVIKAGTDIEALLEPLFLLVGMSTRDSPPARFQPLALPEVLDHVDAVLLMHRDKHGHALGVYTRQILDAEAKLKKLADRKKSMLISFAIPPMLARWDRAIAEAKAVWDPETDGEFPVPESDNPYSWERRRKGRRRKDDPKSEESEDTIAEAPAAEDASDQESPTDMVKAAPSKRRRVKKVVEPIEEPPSQDFDEFDDLFLVAED
ncbi:MAG: hypothetical protein ACJAZO_005109 [Myxococcota bacterium]|jgi:hypothetical protein